MFLPSQVYVNKLALHSELIIFIRYKNNKYHFIYHIQENIIFCSTHAIFDERLFPKCTDLHTKECKLYDKLLDKISPEIELLVPNPFEKDRSALVPTPYTFIPPIQNNLPTHSSLSSISYKSIFPPSIPRFKKLIVEIKENDDVSSDIEM